MTAMGHILQTPTPPPAGESCQPLGAAGSSSLDRSETNQQLEILGSRASRWFHRGTEPERRAILDALTDADDDTLERRSRRIRLCCCSAMLYARSSGRIVAVPTRCRDRVCPTCSRMRAKITAERTAEACRRMDSIRLITLTAPAVEAPLAEQLRQLRKALGAFRRSRDWRDHVRGGVYVIEVTLNTTTGRWHPHVHILADGDFWLQSQIKAGWRSALRAHTTAWSIEDDGHVIVDVRKVHDARDAARYLAKYVSKAAGIDCWPAASIREYALALHGSRALATFGTLHGTSLDPADANEPADSCEALVPMGMLAAAAAGGDGEAVFALRGLLVYKHEWRSLVGWEPPPIPEVDRLPLDQLLANIARWCRSVFGRWPSTRREVPRIAERQA